MGVEFERIVSEHVDNGLICPICTEILDKPLMVDTCEHTYCTECIENWMQSNKTCPQDRNTICPKHLVQIPRFMKNQLFNLRVKCKYMTRGCPYVSTLDAIQVHENDCQFNEKNTRMSRRVDSPSKEIDVFERIGKTKRSSVEVMRSSLPKPFKKKMVKLVKEALYLCGRIDFGHIAAYIKTHLEPEESIFWQCIVGSDYDCLLTAAKYYITLRIDGIYIIAFKTK